MAMMGIKNGVKHWSDAQVTPVTKQSPVKNISPEEAALLGNEPVGDILNKVADPNWIDPTKKVRAVGSDKLDKDAFMKLMLAQMRSQDPTNPLKSHEMAAQLAQFSQLEQMQNLNNKMDELVGSQKPTESFQALNFIGKAVMGDSARLTRTKGDRDHLFTFDLPDAAASADIKVVNEKGEVVREVSLKNLKKGENSWLWSGRDSQDLSQPTGDYQFVVEAKNSAGKKLNVKTDFSGTITGINYTPEGPVLLVGTQSVKLKDVKKIVDPRLAQAEDQKVNPQQKPDLSKPQASLENKGMGAKEPSLLENAKIEEATGLSREMMNALAEQGVRK